MYGSPGAKDLNRPFPQMSSGLLRYRSAPSSVFGELCDDEDFLPVRSSCPETNTVFPRFLPPDLRLEICGNPPPPPAAATGGRAGGGGQRNFQFLPKPPSVAVSVAEENAICDAAFSSAGSQMLYQQIPNNLVPSIGMETDQIKNSSNLIHQSSSPAGLFSCLSAENGYGVKRGTRLKSQLSFPSRQSSATMSQISEEIENESNRVYATAPWEEFPLSTNSHFSGGRLKRSRENKSDFKDSEDGNGLTHQFSLPKNLSEMAAMEKFLEFHDSVPCKIRAKRGCATHPRSIAERMRRTRISERMRKLQELVPNMDKQTNTADMLDLAVEYIKDLQKEVEILSESRASCTCSSGKGGTS